MDWLIAAFRSLSSARASPGGELNSSGGGACGGPLVGVTYSSARRTCRPALRSKTVCSSGPIGLLSISPPSAAQCGTVRLLKAAISGWAASAFAPRGTNEASKAAGNEALLRPASDNGPRMSPHRSSWVKWNSPW